MKKISKYMIVILVLILMIPSISAISTEQSYGRGVKVAILSDLHINRGQERQKENLKKALTYLKECSSNIDGIIFVGDMTDHGYEDEYDEFIKIYEEYGDKKWKTIYTMGNHEYWNGLDVKSSQKLFKEKLKGNLFEKKKINGYTFLTVSPEDERVEGFYSDNTIEKIKKVEKKINNKPLFIFTHHAPKDSNYNTEANGNNQLSKLLDLKSNVIYFSGHLHTVLNNNKTISQDNITVVNTGSISYLSDKMGKVQVEKCPYGSQGLLMEVSKDGLVTINRLDFLREERIKEPWVIDLKLGKEGFKYTNKDFESEEPPYFKDSSIDNLKYKNKDLKFEFKQCNNKEDIERYNIILKDKNNKERVIKISSQYYLGKDTPEFLTVNIDGVDEGEYILEITALGQNGKVSLNNISQKIKI